MNMRKPQYLTIIAIYLDESKTSLADQLKELPGTWDVINLDGTLTTISNNYDNKDIFYSDSFTRIAYVKSLKHNKIDNRTYKQVDSIEAYIRYKLLKNPFLYICDSNIFTEYTMGLSLENLAKEIGIHNRNLMFKYDEQK